MHKSDNVYPIKMHPPDISRWWRHRRRHSYLAISAAILETIALMAGWSMGADLDKAEPMIWPSYVLWGSVIGAYIGASTADDLKARALGQHPGAQ